MIANRNTAFSIEYVEGLRREGQRKGKRIRELEEALIAKVVAAELLHWGIEPSIKVDLGLVYVDDKGFVKGAVDAVKKYREGSDL